MIGISRCGSVLLAAQRWAARSDAGAAAARPAPLAAQRRGSGGHPAARRDV